MTAVVCIENVLAHCMTKLIWGDVTQMSLYGAAISKRQLVMHAPTGGMLLYVQQGSPVYTHITSGDSAYVGHLKQNLMFSINMPVLVLSCVGFALQRLDRAPVKICSVQVKHNASNRPRS